MSKKPSIALINTGTSNIRSVYYALTECNADVTYIKNFSDAKKKIDAIVVPGIGNFSFVMNKLKEEKLDKLIYDKIDSKIPSFFICVGMQILFSISYEFGTHEGLGVFKGEVKKIYDTQSSGERRVVPFIGWNKLIKNKKCAILDGISENDFFYFTHSFFVEPQDKSIVSSNTNYKNLIYCSSVSHENIFATQFHPEKSGVSGLKIYKNFIGLI